jgi:hypothetical protein
MAKRPEGKGESAISALTGAGPSQVGVGGAMRARDVSRPRPEDYAAFVAEPKDQPEGSGGKTPDDS